MCPAESSNIANTLLMVMRLSLSVKRVSTLTKPIEIPVTGLGIQEQKRTLKLRLSELAVRVNPVIIRGNPAIQKYKV